MRNLTAFHAQMDRLAGAFNRPCNQQTKDAYAVALDGVTDDEFAGAASKALTACDRWPFPKVLLGFAMEERGRLRALSGRPMDADTAHCPTCGGTPAWRHKTLGRMHIVHLRGYPCERYNRPPPDEVTVTPEVFEPGELTARKADTLKALRGEV